MSDYQSQSRREFLKHSVAALGAAGAISMTSGCTQKTAGPCGATQAGGCCAAGRQPAWAVTCRDVHLACTGKPDTWSAAEAIGADGMEVVVSQDLSCPSLYAKDEKFSLANAAEIARIAERCKASGKKITAFCLGNKFDADPDGEVVFVRRVAEAAATLGVPVVRLDYRPGDKYKGKEAEFLKFSVAMAQRILKATEATGVRYGVENHGNTTNKVEFMRPFLAEVDSDRFGVTLDTANLYWFGYPLSKLYEIYEEYAPKVVHTHCKSIGYPADQREKQRPMGWEYGKYCCPLYEGDIDFNRVARILKKAGCTGDLCIENESLRRMPEDQQAGVLKKEIQLLRAAARQA